MSDTLKIVRCPACSTSMKKIYIDRIGRNIDICINCGGIFFDNLELNHFDKQNKSIKELEDVLQDSKNAKVLELSKRICPSCEELMTKIKIQDLIIDECHSCGGIFFDNGELQEYRNKYPTEKERTDASNKKLGEILDKINLQ